MQWLSRRRFLATMVLAASAPRALRAGAARRVIDDAGRRVTIPSDVKRVYTAGPPASILVYALAPERLLGWTTSFRPAERLYVPEKYADLPTLGRLTGRGNTANVEVVLAAKPDLIIDYGSIRPTFSSLADRVQDQTGIPYILLDGAFDRIPESLRKVGDIVGEPERGEEWVRYARTMLDDISARVSKIPAAKRARVYYGRGPTGLVTGLSGSINVEALERIGAINVAAELGRGGLAQISIEQALGWNPDIIVTTDPNFYSTAQVLPLWSALPAVRNGRLYLAPAVPFGWIDFPPSINRLLGLYWLGKVIYPELFPEDLRSRVREFYTRAYHRAPSDGQVEELLASTRKLRT